MKNFEESKYFGMFKAYDMRAIVGEGGLHSGVYYFAAQGLVKEILEPENLPNEVCVMMDARTSSPEFYTAYIKGLESVGAKVIKLGMGSSDLLYAATIKFGLPGVMITASHNPKEYNGMKIVKKTPQVVGLSSGLDKIRDYVISKLDIEKSVTPEFTINVGEDEIKKAEVLEFMVSKLEEIGSIGEVDKILGNSKEKLRVVVDAANGMGGMVMELVKKMYTNVEFIELYWEPDGNFPNHPADPMDENNLIDAKSKVMSTGANLGAMLDGDGDRCVLIDENSETILGDYLVATIGDYFVKQVRSGLITGYNPAVVYPYNNSRCISQAILEADGIPIPTKQGHVFIKEEMAKYNAIYGGEGSNHHYFGQFGSMDSGALNLVMSIKLMILQGQKASEVTKKWQKKYQLSGENNIRLENGLSPKDVMNKLIEYYHDGAVGTLDGVVITYDDWRFSVRSSNTEPLLRFNVEIVKPLSTSTPLEKLTEVLKVAGIK